MVPTFDIAGTHELSPAEMQSIVGGDGWMQAIGSAWSTGVTFVCGAITGAFSSSGSAVGAVQMNGLPV